MNEVFDKLLSVEFDNLPPRVQTGHLVKPWLSVPLQLADDGFAVLSPALLDRPAPAALLPKLALKSWRDVGTLGLIYEGVTMLKVARLLLARPTLQQRTIARAWLKSGLTPRLHLLPYVDFAEISEARFLINPRGVQLVSTCMRGVSAPVLSSAITQLHSLAQDVAELLPRRSHVLDLACMADGEIRIVEVNPALSPRDLAQLRVGA